MRHLCAAALSVSLCGTALADMPAGVTEPDGSTRYALKFGTIARKPDGTVAMRPNGAKDWLLIGAKGFAFRNMQSTTGGIVFNTETNPEGLVMSAYFETVDKAGKATECREFYFPKALSSPYPKENVRRSDDGARAIGAYVMIGKKSAVKLSTEHRNIYLYTAGHCIDVHVSKAVLEGDGYEAQMERVTQSISLVPAGD